MEQGLSNSTVTSIYKDRFGFMWFGSFDGLNRYDGYSFEKFRNQIGDSTSIPDNHVSAIGESPDGNLIVGTKRGAAILNYSTFHFTYPRYLSKGKAKLLDKPVSGIRTDKRGCVYLASSGCGLLIIKKNEKVALQIPVKSVLDYNVSSLEIDRQGIVWFYVTELGLCRYFPEKGRVELVSNQLKSANCFKFDNSNRLWIGTNAGLYYLAYPYKTLKQFDLPSLNLSSSRIMDLTMENNRFLWTSTDGDGLPVIDINSNTVHQKLEHDEDRSLSSNSLYTVFIDSENRKWIGTMRGGINVVDSARNIFKTISHEPYKANTLVHNTVFSFCEDGKDVWIGTDGGGISIWNREKNAFRSIVFPNPDRRYYGLNQITSIIKDDEQNIWLGSYGSGVRRFNRKTGAFENVPFVQNDKGAKYVFRLFKDTEGKIWAGCIKGRYAGNMRKGLWLYDPARKSFVEAPYPVFEEILSISDDRDGNLWIGTLKNLIRINKKTSAIRSFSLESYVRAIKCDKDNRIWVGTIGGGLLLFDQKKEAFKVFSEKDGLPNNMVVSIEEDSNGYLWLGTFNGLSRLNKQTLKFENFYAGDGLQSNQFYYNASANLSTGEILFGGIKGFNIFSPKAILLNRKFPPIRFTGFSVLNSPVGSDSEFTPDAPSLPEIKQIVLPYDKSMFALDIVALEYSFPQKIQYAYFLKGWDKAWNYTNNLNKISYSRLNEGNYILEIKSTNTSGLWNPQPITIKVKVLPPWYRTWWAYCFYIFCLGAAVYAYIRYQKEKARLQFELKLTSLKAQQEEELNEKKISFFTNVAHELRTPLTLIVNPIEDLLNNDGRNVNLVDISSVHRNTRRLLSLVDQLLLFRSTENELSDLKPEAMDVAEICNEVFLCFKNQVKKRGLDYRFENKTEGLKVFADREKTEIVLFNLLSNAIKYADEKGTVSMLLTEEAENVVLNIKNTGPVIPAQVGETLFQKFYRLEQLNVISKKSGFGIGLFTSKKIAEKQGGSLTYTSNAEEGTIFSYIFPKNNSSIDLNTIEEGKSANSALLSELFAELPEREADKQKGTVSENMRNVIEGVAESKPTVLVVDDDEDMRAYINQLLSPGYNVFEAISGEQALEIMVKAEPDIILSDVVMGGMSGVDFCARIKESKEYSHVPVLLLTATSSAEIKLKGIECGADDYVTKPFEKDLLLARIKSILKGRDSLKRYFFNEVTLQNNSERVSEEYTFFLKKCIAIVEGHLEDEQFGVKQFAAEIGMSHSNLFRKVKAISGSSVNVFIRYIRLKKAAELMIQTDLQIKEIAFMVGFQDPRYFREQFSKLFGSNPSEYVKKYRRTFLRAPGS